MSARAMISPSTQAGMPVVVTRLTTVSACSAGRTTRKPTPMLSVRSRSDRGRGPGAAVDRGQGSLRQDSGEVRGEPATRDVAEGVDVYLPYQVEDWCGVE